jgi:hypothetical protein
MRALLAVMAATAATATARADVAFDLSAGAGTETGTDAYATANGTLAAEWSHPAPPIADRLPLYFDGGFGFWTFVGTEPDDWNGARAEVSATALADTLIGSARGAARGYGWELDLGVDDQPVGGLRDAFWRSGRHVIAGSIGVAIPMLYTIGTEKTRTSLGGIELQFTGRAREAGAPFVDGGLDAEIAWHSVRVQGRRWTLDLLDVHASNHEVAQSEVTVLDATEVALDVVAASCKLAPTLEVSAHAGLNQGEPIAQFSTMADAQGAVPPHVETPRYWLELAEHAGARKVSVGAGSWARLDPTGGAADAGQLVDASYRDRIGSVDVRASIQAGQLRRMMVTSYAPPGVPPVGTKMRMGRGELAASMHVMHDLDVVATAWVERSDRDDPRWLVPADGTLETHAGGDITARWRLHVQ